MLNNKIVEESIFSLFKKQAVKCANQTAAVYKGNKISYKELLDYSINLGEILKENGLRSGDIICIYVPTSFEFLISIFAVLSIGCICLPIEYKAPEDKFIYILKNSQARALLYQNNLDELSYNNIIKLQITINDLKTSENNEHNTTISSGACSSYCIYTSGSTGEPKGVLLSSMGIINHAYAKINDLNINSDDIISQSLGIGFVASIWQYVAPIFVGAKTILYSEAAKHNAYEIFMKIDRDCVTILETTPSVLTAYLKLLTNKKRKLPLRKLRYIILTGEKVESKLVESFYRNYGIPLLNAYGQTECSDDTFHYLIPYNNNGNISIGKPIINTGALILDEELKKIETGELYISGKSLAIGYLNDAQLTLEKFITYPNSDNTRLFKTGDIVQKRSDGNYELLGRVDNQIKIRGYRIQLEEIERSVNEYRGIEQTIVVQEDTYGNEDVLIAFYTNSKQIDINKLEVFLRKRLPGYMIPKIFIKLEEFELNNNQKIDRNQLKKLIPKKPNYNVNKLDNANHIEAAVIETIKNKVICDVNITGKTLIGSLNIDSIIFVQLVVSLEEAFAIEFEDEKLTMETFHSVESVVDYIKSRLYTKNIVKDE